ncbi:hypothetical protein AV540_13545 [Brevibacillus parabrevis]|nr:hypothetical protein AV540_13545 [Brevibacillus parabrevis]
MGAGKHRDEQAAAAGGTRSAGVISKSGQSARRDAWKQNAAKVGSWQASVSPDFVSVFHLACRPFS